jgi:glycosyltransferase involved in cell wall biosynthesis
VLTLSYTTWQAAWRRGLIYPDDRLVGSLVRSERVGRLLVCNHARSMPLKLLRWLSGFDRVPFPTDDRTQLVQPLRLARRDSTSIRGVERQFAAYDRALRRAASSHGLRDPVVITAHPLVAGFAELSWARAVTWYALDDWAELPALARWSSVNRESYERVRLSRRRVAAVSRPLLERVAPAGAGVVVPNGLDPGEWSAASAPPPWVVELPRPLLVYAGQLDSRINVDWLIALAHAQPSATIALLGRVVDPQHLAPLRELTNVRFTGVLPRGPLASILRAADVGLLPHIASQLTGAMSPLKLFEYLAAGLPVVATDLPPIREIGHDRVVLVPPAGDYVAGVSSALALERVPEHERLRFVEENSWRSRHEQLLDLALS